MAQRKKAPRLAERVNAAGNWELRCPECGVWIEEVNLAAAVYHGLGHDPERAARFADIEPGWLQPDETMFNS